MTSKLEREKNFDEMIEETAVSENYQYDLATAKELIKQWCEENKLHTLACTEAGVMGVRDIIRLEDLYNFLGIK